MKVNQKTKENEKQLYVGWGIVQPLMFNPEKKELMSIYDKTEEETEDWKEPNYLGEKDGCDTARITLYVKTLKTGEINRMSFFLKNNPVEKEETNTKRFVNQLGVFQSVKDEKDLFSSFSNFERVTSWKDDEGNVTTKYPKGKKAVPAEKEVYGKKEYRQAIEGEEKLMNFLKNVLIAVDYSDPETDLFVNMKQIFSGDFSELNFLIKDGKIGNFIAPHTIKTDDSSGEIKEYQEIHNGYAINETYARFLRVYDMSEENIEKLQISYRDNKKREKMKPLELFIAGTTNKEYPIKEFYINQELAEYDPTQNVVSNNEVVNHNDSSY